ncbi:MAG: N-acetyltransferase [Anaerolineae bacterium]
MSEVQRNTFTLRKATVRDVPAMARIINSYATQGQMLPKSQHQLYQFVRDFVVAVQGDQVVGCGALHVVWEDLAELRSMAVAQDWRGRGVGRAMARYLMDEARELGVPQLFALTYHPDFFGHLGFGQVPRDALPQKIWGDCLNCPKYPNCDETALMINLNHDQENGDEG